jgi:hypothetical protein
MPPILLSSVVCPALPYFSTSRKLRFSEEKVTEQKLCVLDSSRKAFLRLWSADHKWSSGSALVVLLD